MITPELKLSGSALELEQMLFDFANLRETSLIEEAIAEKEMNDLDKFEKPIFYSQMPESGGTEELRKRSAYTSEVYKKHLDAFVNARYKYKLARAKTISCEVKYEAIKTVLLKRNRIA